ncbi:aspartate/glutamate racemase family protein [Poseidonocella sp. HB161398]|uniref:aspartate/glutamate racemase family protein n=1 Tax=Poseidonocella sp. HB161398 TaxID=2320855 RepID=UPI001107C440|nr:aspartate/glutamate racemase family protein [Poseidonocella sp. HB161398]
MTLLIVNSNTTQGITDLVAAEARRAAGPGTAIRAVTAPFGPAAIETQEDARIAGLATLQALREAAPPVEAAIIACFSDPGLAEARRTLPFPVFGIAEAAMRRAAALGPRFSILTVAPSTLPGIRATAAQYGFGDRLAGVHALDQRVLESHSDPDGTARAMAELAQQVLAAEAPDVLVLGGAVTAGLQRRLAGQVPVPLLEGLSCALAEALAACAAPGA